MNTTKPSVRYHYRKVTADYGDGRVVIAAYSAGTGAYICRLFLIGNQWSNGKVRRLFPKRELAVDAYLDAQSSPAGGRGGRVRHIADL